jgi:hypothetical protein
MRCVGGEIVTGVLCLIALFDFEGENRTMLLNVCNLSPIDIAQHAKRPKYSGI